MLYQKMMMMCAEQEVEVRFDGEKYNLHGPYYLVRIGVKTLQHGEDLFYEVDFNYSFERNSATLGDMDFFKKNYHPFYRRGEKGCASDLQYGGMIIKNAMTTMMIDYLLMEDDVLRKRSGCNNPQKYRKSIMFSLSYFWGNLGSPIPPPSV